VIADGRFCGIVGRKGGPDDGVKTGFGAAACVKNMEFKPIKVLLLEDNSGDTRRLRELLGE